MVGPKVKSLNPQAHNPKTQKCEGCFCLPFPPQRYATPVQMIRRMIIAYPSGAQPVSPLHSQSSSFSGTCGDLPPRPTTAGPTPSCLARRLRRGKGGLTDRAEVRTQRCAPEPSCGQRTTSHAQRNTTEITPHWSFKQPCPLHASAR